MSSSSTSSHTKESLGELKLPQLKALCKEKNLPVSGTKNELIDRILTGVSISKSTKKQQNFEKQMLQKPVFQTMLGDCKERSPILIKRNTFGNFEHADTKLVFSIEKKVIGIQSPDGSISPLSIQDLENIRKFYFEIDPGTKISEEPPRTTFDGDEPKQRRLEELLTMTASSELAQELVGKGEPGGR